MTHEATRVIARPGRGGVTEDHAKTLNVTGVTGFFLYLSYKNLMMMIL